MSSETSSNLRFPRATSSRSPGTLGLIDVGFECAAALRSSTRRHDKYFLSEQSLKLRDAWEQEPNAENDPCIAAGALLWELTDVVVLSESVLVRDEILDWVRVRFPRVESSDVIGSSAAALKSAIDRAVVGDAEGASEALLSHPEYARLCLADDKNLTLTQEESLTLDAFAAVQIALERAPKGERSSRYALEAEFNEWHRRSEESFVKRLNNFYGVSSDETREGLSSIARVLCGDENEAMRRLRGPYDHWAHLLAFRLAWVKPLVRKNELAKTIRACIEDSGRRDVSDLCEICFEIADGEVMLGFQAFRDLTNDDPWGCYHFALILANAKGLEVRRENDADLPKDAFLLEETQMDVVETTMCLFVDALCREDRDEIAGDGFRVALTYLENASDDDEVGVCEFAAVQLVELHYLTNALNNDNVAEALRSHIATSNFQALARVSDAVARARLSAWMASGDVANALKWAEGSRSVVSLASDVLRDANWEGILALASHLVDGEMTDHDGDSENASPFLKRIVKFVKSARPGAFYELGEIPRRLKRQALLSVTEEARTGQRDLSVQDAYALMSIAEDLQAAHDCGDDDRALPAAARVAQRLAHAIESSC